MQRMEVSCIDNILIACCHSFSVFVHRCLVLFSHFSFLAALFEHFIFFFFEDKMELSLFFSVCNYIFKCSFIPPEHFPRKGHPGAVAS